MTLPTTPVLTDRPDPMPPLILPERGKALRLDPAAARWTELESRYRELEQERAALRPAADPRVLIVLLDEMGRVNLELDELCAALGENNQALPQGGK